MKLSAKQRNALSLIWGEDDPPDDESIRAYFEFTDRGQKLSCSLPDFSKLLFNHKCLGVTVEMWKEGFSSGMLFLHEFDEEREALREHAYKVYHSCYGLIPRNCRFREEFLWKFNLPEYS